MNEQKYDMKKDKRLRYAPIALHTMPQLSTEELKKIKEVKKIDQFEDMVEIVGYWKEGESFILINSEHFTMNSNGNIIEGKDKKKIMFCVSEGYLKELISLNKISNMNKQNPNHAHIEIAEKSDRGEAEILLQDKKIGMIHTQADPKAEFDLVVEDNVGNEQFRKKVSNPTGRWGERVDLEVTDNQFKVKVENVKNAKVVDVFIE